MGNSIIVMADVVRSRKANAKKTAAGLKQIVSATNKKFNKEILSPLTITLGDEFQSVVKSVETGIQVILFIEEFIISNNVEFKLRYVIVSGKIDTPINKKIAYGMLGDGLTKARETINSLKKSDERFSFFTGKGDSTLNNLFIIYQSIVDSWKQSDYKIISDFIKLDDYKLVAEENDKTPSLMWKRKKSLQIKEYKTIKKLILPSYGLE